MWICQNCYKIHDQQHREKVRLQLRQWMEESEEFGQSADCNICSAEARCRLQCGTKDCGHALCLRCSQTPSTMEKFLQAHLQKYPTHRLLYAIFPPYWYIPKIWRINPCTCYSLSRLPAPGHCKRCHARRYTVHHY